MRLLAHGIYAALIDETLCKNSALFLLKTLIVKYKVVEDWDCGRTLVDIRPLQPELWITEKYISLSTQMQHDLDGYRKLVKLGRKLCELQNK